MKFSLNQMREKHEALNTLYDKEEEWRGDGFWIEKMAWLRACKNLQHGGHR